MDERIRPEAAHEVIMLGIYELVESFLPERDKGMPLWVELKVCQIDRLIRLALGLDPDGLTVIGSS